MTCDTVPPVDILPEEIVFSGMFQGDGLSYDVDWPEDNSDQTHEIWLAYTPDGQAFKALTNGDGLTVGAYSGGITPVHVVIDQTYSVGHNYIYWRYRIDGETQMFGHYEYTPAMTAPT